MMTDRELLKLAAKAAGYEVSEMNPGVNWYFEIIKDNGKFVYGHHKKPWNPLTDDGDALRLAVDLSFMVSVHEEKEVRVIWWPIGGSRHEVREIFANDRYSAARRAIVSAAAEIGKRIESKDE